MPRNPPDFRAIQLSKSWGRREDVKVQRFHAVFLSIPWQWCSGFLEQRADTNISFTLCNSGREVRRAVVLPLEQAQGRAAIRLQEEDCKADGPFSTSHFFVSIHLESLVCASCEKRITDYNWTHLKKTVLYTIIIISISIWLFIFSFLFIAWVNLAHLKFCCRRSRILCNWWYFTAE